MTRLDFNKAPSVSAVLIACAATLFGAGVMHGAMLSRGSKPHTMSDQWVKANQEYMKFQKMNPIFGISKGL